MTRRGFFPLLLAPAAPAFPAPPDQRRTFLSFNLRYINRDDKGWRTWTARRDWVGEIITRENPDVVGVQEALRPMLDDLMSRLKGYGEIGVGREDGRTKGEYSAILYKKEALTADASGTFWLSDTPEVPNSRTWGNTVTRICTWARFRPNTGDSPFYVFNAHFDHQSQESREKSVQLITKRIDAREPKAPFLFMGDLNAGENNPVIQQLKNGSLKLRDTWREVHPSTAPGESGTLHAFSGRADMAKIDYIFAQQGVEIVEAAILRDRRAGPIFPSDHFPVRAVVKI